MTTTTNTSKQTLEVFGINALIGKEKGLTVQEVAGINKEAAMLMLGMSEEMAEKAVSMWVDACKESGIMATNN